MLSVFGSLAVGLAAPVSVAAAPVGITTGRAQSLAALMVGLLSVVIGGLALARSAGRSRTVNARGRAIVALLAGLIGMVFGGVRLANSGAIGTGSGRLGAIVALAVALIGTVLGGLALARSRRTS